MRNDGESFNKSKCLSLSSCELGAALLLSNFIAEEIRLSDLDQRERQAEIPPITINAESMTDFDRHFQLFSPN